MKRAPAMTLVVVFALAGCGGEATTPDATATSTDPGGGATPPSETQGEPASSIDQLYEAALEEGELVVYTDNASDVAQSFVDTFTELYPGIDVTLWSGDSASLSERLLTEYGANVDAADVFHAAEARTYELDEAGIIEPYSAEAAEALSEEFRVAGDRWNYFAQSLLGFSWNTDCIPAGEEPQEYEDLLDPKWQGMIGIQDPVQGGGARSWIATMYYVWGEEYWTDYMTRLAAQEPAYGDYFVVADELAGGEICIHVAANVGVTEGMRSDGAPVQWATPDPMMVSRFSINLHSRASNPNAAKLYIEYLLSEEAQQVWVDDGGIPVLSGLSSTYDRIDPELTHPNEVQQILENLPFFEEKMVEFFAAT